METYSCIFNEAIASECGGTFLTICITSLHFKNFNFKWKENVET